MSIVDEAIDFPPLLVDSLRKLRTVVFECKPVWSLEGRERDEGELIKALLINFLGGLWETESIKRLDNSGDIGANDRDTTSFILLT